MTDGGPPNPWAEIIGPCYTAESIAHTLGWTPGQVAAAVESLSILELETYEGAPLYPAFQVVDGRILAGFGDVLRALATGTTSSWTWAQWLNTPVEDETGEESPSAIEELRAGQVDDVLRDALHTAAAWNS